MGASCGIVASSLVARTACQREVAEHMEGLYASLAGGTGYFFSCFIRGRNVIFSKQYPLVHLIYFLLSRHHCTLLVGREQFPKYACEG